MAENKNNDDSRRNYRIKVEFADFFQWGLYQIKPVVPDTEYSGDPNRPGPQRRDDQTGLPIWRLPVTDAGEPNSRRASYDVYLLSDTDPVPGTQEFGRGMRPIALEGVTVQPRIGGQGEYKFIQYVVRATGFSELPSTGGRSGGSGSAGGSASGKTAS
ncbi:hypothetical protein [Nocardia mexicana]|nr:hypothetical protein [Nocardia mexicana]